MIRATIATEDLIGQKIGAGAKTSEQSTLQRSSAENKDGKESGLFASDRFTLKLQVTLFFSANHESSAPVQITFPC